MLTERRRLTDEAAAAPSRWKEGSSAGAEDDRDSRGEKEADEDGGDQLPRLPDEDGLGMGKRGGAGRAERSGVGGGNMGVGMAEKTNWQIRQWLCERRHTQTMHSTTEVRKGKDRKGKRRKATNRQRTSGAQQSKQQRKREGDGERVQTGNTQHSAMHTI